MTRGAKVNITRLLLSCMGVFFIFILAVIIRPEAAEAEADTNFTAPAYSLNRADEDYRYLRDPARRVEFWDSVKYVALNESGSSYLSLGGEARERYEYFSNPNWGAGPQGSGYLLQRYFLHADLHMGEHLRLFTQLQSSLENGRTGGPRPTDKDELDLHQAFLDIKFDSGGGSSFLLRSGRQELIYGSQRIISVREGPNVRQSFDGFRAMFRTGDVAVDAFAARPAETKRYVFDDGTDNSRGLWGVYSVMPLSMLPKGNVDLYYLGYHNRNASFNQGSASETRHSVGARLWRTAKPIDYNFEFIYQWGKFGNGDIQAWTAASDTGYTFDSLTFHPRLGLKADVTSGDRDPNNPDLQSFNPLFPKGAYFSEDALIGPINHIDLNPSVTLQFTGSVMLSVNWDFFWRESTHDGLYNSGLSLVRSSKNSSASFVGSQPQAVLEWDIDRHFTFVAIYAHFFAGPFIKETGAGKDVDYTTAWLAYRF
ncbi:MAG TPA: alginate export family protein [Thermodesulfovibrionales bacterium]|nr:alginate export family protein [Thermodesulfovibrionales bacterium]